MTHKDTRIPKSIPFLYSHRDRQTFEHRGGPSHLQYNEDNLSSTQLAATMAASTSDGGTTNSYSESWTLASLGSQLGDQLYMDYQSDEAEYEQNYTIHQPPSYGTMDTAGTDQTEKAIPDSTDGRGLPSHEIPRRDSFVVVDFDKVPAPTPTPPQLLEFGRLPVSSRNLDRHVESFSHSYNGHPDDWVRTSGPRYAHLLVEQVSTASECPSGHSTRSSVISQDWVLPPVPHQVGDTAATLMGMGMWQSHAATKSPLP